MAGVTVAVYTTLTAENEHAFRIGLLQRFLVGLRGIFNESGRLISPHARDEAVFDSRCQSRLLLTRLEFLQVASTSSDLPLSSTCMPAGTFGSVVSTLKEERGALLD